jgi:putative endonuclease
MKNTKQWQVYIIQSQDGKLYTGITNDINRRFKEHLSKKAGARFFHFSDAKSIVFCEAHPNRSEASKREIEIKKMNRPQKLKLINS